MKSWYSAIVIFETLPRFLSCFIFYFCFPFTITFRSPKRTISFDFPSDLDPRHVREIHRQVMHMALQAGSANSVKIVGEIALTVTVVYCVCGVVYVLRSSG